MTNINKRQQKSNDDIVDIKITIALIIPELTPNPGQPQGRGREGNRPTHPRGARQGRGAREHYSGSGDYHPSTLMMFDTPPTTGGRIQTRVVEHTKANLISPVAQWRHVQGE